jgi:circadian clock protein KaiC
VANNSTAIPRVTTEVPGLDTILKGGLWKGGVYLVMGVPGAGKTILANQISFNHVAAGGRSLYLTLLTESHARMLSALAGMKFFDEKRLGNEMTYLSGFQTLVNDKLDGLLGMIRKQVREHHATLLVLDGLITAAGIAESDLALKKFIHELQVLLEMVGCTALLLTGLKSEESNYPERTMVDGLISLSRRRIGQRSLRELEVSKHRGSDLLAGGHFFDISEAGITIHPRTEAVVGARIAALTEAAATVAMGEPELDTMLGGGPLAGSTTLVVGSPGSGKTTFGMQFLATGAKKGDPGLYFGFFEPPHRLREKSKQLTIDVARYEGSGLLTILWQSPVETFADALAEKLFDAITATGAKRVFIDGLAGFYDSMIDGDRTKVFLVALTNELRARGVTTLISGETPQVLDREMRLPEGGLSSIVENLIVLRYLEENNRLRRMMSVVKMRESVFDPSFREFTLSDRGIEIVHVKSVRPVKSSASRSKRRSPRGK